MANYLRLAGQGGRSNGRLPAFAILKHRAGEQAHVLAATFWDSAGAAAFQLLTNPGSYALTGFNVEFVYTPVAGAFELLTTPGAYTITGSSVTLLSARSLLTTPGAYSLTGFSATFLASRLVQVTPGAYILTGVDVSLDWSGSGPAASGGDYIITFRRRRR